MRLFRRNDKKIRRWYRKKRWWIIIILSGITWYNANDSNGGFFQDRIDSIEEIIPFLSD